MFVCYPQRWIKINIFLSYHSYWLGRREDVDCLVERKINTCFMLFVINHKLKYIYIYIYIRLFWFSHMFAWYCDVSCILSQQQKTVLIIALKIHISAECRKALEELGGWVITRRGIIEIKVSSVLSETNRMWSVWEFYCCLLCNKSRLIDVKRYETICVR